MAISTVAERGVATHGASRDAHLLLVADGVAAQRAGTVAWLDRELALGAKVYYKGWPPAGGHGDRHWLAGPDGSRRTREAFGTGQLEFADYPTVIERCGGTSEGLAALQTRELERAGDDGWPSVAMTQESASRPLTDDAQVAEFAAQEHTYDVLAARWPLRVLCQLTVPAEDDVAVWESLALHHGAVRDDGWAADLDVADGGRWRLEGDLDAHVVRRFGGALTGALRRARHAATGPDLHVDLDDVAFLDVACARMVVLAARSAPPGQRLVLHGLGRVARRLLDALDRPASVVFAEERP